MKKKDDRLHLLLNKIKELEKSDSVERNGGNNIINEEYSQLYQTYLQELDTYCYEKDEFPNNLLRQALCTYPMKTIDTEYWEYKRKEWMESQNKENEQKTNEYDSNATEKRIA